MNGLDGLAIDPVHADERPLLENLTQLYLHDFSELFAGTQRLDLGETGLFRLDPPLDRWWQAADHVPLLLRWHGHPAGFALVNADSHMGMPVDRAIVEFFVVRKYRRLGLGLATARSLFARWPGPWEIAVLRANRGAAAFWERAITGDPTASEVVVHDRSDAKWDGPVYRFRSACTGTDGCR